MSENGMNYLELEYEHLYNMRDQAIPFLRQNPDTQGYVNEVLGTLNEWRYTGRRLTVSYENGFVNIPGRVKTDGDYSLMPITI